MDTSLLEAALQGYKIRLEQIDASINYVKRRLGQRTSGARKRHISPEGRERIAEAQRKRWAKHHEQAALASMTAAASMPTRTPKMRAPKRRGRPPGSKNKKK